jgi:predicted nuclease with TOPRIM domain
MNSDYSNQQFNEIKKTLQDTKEEFSKDIDNLKSQLKALKMKTFLNKKFSWKAIQQTNQMEDRISRLEDKLNVIETT